MGKLLKSEIEAAARVIIRNLNAAREKKYQEVKNSKKYKESLEKLDKKYGIDEINKLIDKANKKGADISLSFSYSCLYKEEKQKITKTADNYLYTISDYKNQPEMVNLIDRITLEQVDGKLGLQKFLKTLEQELIDSL